MINVTLEKNYRILNPEETFAQAFVREVNNDLNDVKHSFIKIGFRLREAIEFEYYKDLGYQNIVELAEAEFGFKQTTTYELMKVHELAHDPDCRWHIAKEFDKYSYSQLLALSYATHVGTALWTIVQPTDSVRKLKRFVTIWNKEYRTGCGYHSELKTVDEYLKAYDEKQADQQAQISEYAGQLKGQIAMSDIEEEPEKEFSERSEKLEQEVAVKEEPIEPMSDSELIKYCLKLGCWTENSKFRVVRSHSEFTRSAFVTYIKREYGYGGRSVSGVPYKSIESSNDGYTICRNNGGKIVLAWAVVAGYISRMIETGEYLDEKEKEQYIEWQESNNGFAVSLPTKEHKEEFSERSENSEQEIGVLSKCSERTAQTNREHLSKLTDKELVFRLCLKILSIFPLHGKSAQFTSTVKDELTKWLSEPYDGLQ